MRCTTCGRTRNANTTPNLVDAPATSATTSTNRKQQSNPKNRATTHNTKIEVVEEDDEFDDDGLFMEVNHVEVSVVLEAAHAGQMANQPVLSSAQALTQLAEQQPIMEPSSFITGTEQSSSSTAGLNQTPETTGLNQPPKTTGLNQPPESTDRLIQPTKKENMLTNKKDSKSAGQAIEDFAASAKASQPQVKLDDHFASTGEMMLHNNNNVKDDGAKHEEPAVLPIGRRAEQHCNLQLPQHRRSAGDRGRSGHRR